MLVLLDEGEAAARHEGRQRRTPGHVVAEILVSIPLSDDESERISRERLCAALCSTGIIYGEGVYGEQVALLASTAPIHPAPIGFWSSE